MWWSETTVCQFAFNVYRGHAYWDPLRNSLIRDTLVQTLKRWCSSIWMSTRHVFMLKSWRSRPAGRGQKVIVGSHNLNAKCYIHLDLIQRRKVAVNCIILREGGDRGKIKINRFLLDGMPRRQKGMPMTTVCRNNLWLPLRIRRHLIVRLRNPDIIWILRSALMSCKNLAISHTKCTSMFFHMTLFHFSLYCSCLLRAAY